MPQRKPVDGYPKLGRWVSRQREAFRNLRLSEEESRKRAEAGIPEDELDLAAKQKSELRKSITRHRIERLNGIGFEWQLKAPKRNLTPEQRAELRTS